MSLTFTIVSVVLTFGFIIVSTLWLISNHDKAIGSGQSKMRKGRLNNFREIPKSIIKMGIVLLGSPRNSSHLRRRRYINKLARYLEDPGLRREVLKIFSEFMLGESSWRLKALVCQYVADLKTVNPIDQSLARTIRVHEPIQSYLKGGIIPMLDEVSEHYEPSESGELIAA